MRLLVDEDSQARTLVRLLREAGHDVLTVDEAGLRSLEDAAVMARAMSESRVLLTRNCGDFLALHQANEEHPGILAVYQDGDPSRNMSYQEVVQAISNLTGAEGQIGGQFVPLNAWRW